MFTDLINTCKNAVEAEGSCMQMPGLQRITDKLSPVIQTFEVSNSNLPWGRYLLHHDEQDLFNIQLDVFSADYTGSAHGHGAWGAFWLLKGRLRAWDYQQVGDELHLARYSVFRPGSCQCFCPPLSDWHKVGTPPGGEQTVSIHIYGQGFDMDTGIAMGPDNVIRSYKRGALGDLDLVLPHIRQRGDL